MQQKILDFWFGPLNSDNYYVPDNDTQMSWWQKSETFDRDIEKNFLNAIYNAATGKLDSWLETPKGRLAIIILLDQMTRNCFRNSAKMYAYDNLALYFALEGIAKGEDKALHPIERVFMYLPLEHAEDPHLQAQCVQLYKDLVTEVPPAHQPLFTGFIGFAKQHEDIIKLFGRFPHRNQLLGRRGTQEELEFLEKPNSRF